MLTVDPVCSSITNRCPAEFSLPVACLVCIHKISIVCTAAEMARTSQDADRKTPFSASFTGSYKGYLSRPTHLWRWSVFMHSGHSRAIVVSAGGALNQSDLGTRAHSRPVRRLSDSSTVLTRCVCNRTEDCTRTWTDAQNRCGTLVRVWD